MTAKIKLFLVWLILPVSFILEAQVGINTSNPQGIFHIDGKKNTSGTSNLKDDIIIAYDKLSGVNVSLGGAPVVGASISLNSTTKGFLPNRVSLTSTLDVTTVPSPAVGMIVYNTMSSGTYPNNTLVGYYIYIGAKWQLLRTNSYMGISSTSTLQTAVTTASSSASGATPLNAPELNFGAIKVFEDGAYAFSFNVSATSSTGALPLKIAQGIVYIYVLRKKVNESSFSYYKMIEFDPPLFPNGASLSISTIAGLQLEAGDQLKFTTRHNSATYSLTYQVGGTYLVYWKL